RALRREGDAQPRAALEVLTAAQALRESLYWIFYAIAHGDAPGREDVAQLERHLTRALAEPRVVRAGERWTVAFAPSHGRRAPLAPCRRWAGGLSASEGVARLRTCSSGRGDWMSLDQTKTRSRRWCDMRDCGNRAKARRHYQRVRSAT